MSAIRFNEETKTMTLSDHIIEQLIAVKKADETIETTFMRVVKLGTFQLGYRVTMNGRKKIERSIGKLIMGGAEASDDKVLEKVAELRATYRKEE